MLQGNLVSAKIYDLDNGVRICALNSPAGLSAPSKGEQNPLAS